MANKTRPYQIEFTWKEDGNRGDRLKWATTGTTVQRAISKLVKDINEGKCSVDVPESLGDDEIRASDLLIINVHTDKP